MICGRCRRDFPAGLIHELTVGVFDADGDARLTREAMCPVCALSLINDVNGFPADTPFRGPTAAEQYKRAVEHLRATGQ